MYLESVSIKLLIVFGKTAITFGVWRVKFPHNSLELQWGISQGTEKTFNSGFSVFLVHDNRQLNDIAHVLLHTLHLFKD